jgi:mannitol-1-phosphate/altronate dehydrogenase
MDCGVRRGCREAKLVVLLRVRSGGGATPLTLLPCERVPRHGDAQRAPIA